jgi:hypothetical protein
MSYLEIETMRHCYIRAVEGGLRKVRNSLCQSRDHFYVKIAKWVKRNNSCWVGTVLDNQKG